MTDKSRNLDGQIERIIGELERMGSDVWFMSGMKKLAIVEEGNVVVDPRFSNAEGSSEWWPALNEGEDLHGAVTSGKGQGIDFIDILSNRVQFRRCCWA